MESACFILKIKPDRIGDYVDIHKKGRVWKEILSNLKNAGLEKMKIYMLENNAIVYVETPDVKKAFDYLGKQESQARWDQATADLMETQPGYGKEEKAESLQCIFDFEKGVQLN